MKTRGRSLGGAAIALALFTASPAHAATVLSLNLDELSARAGRVFRGRVLDARAGSVEAGGATLPTTTYRIQVDEAFKGRYAKGAKGEAIAEIRMIGSARETAKARGEVRTLSLMPDVPRLEVGQEYLLFTTVPGRAGLSTTVGLGQGSFRVYRPKGRAPVAVNAFDNKGLLRGMSRRMARGTTEMPSRGPVPYDELARRIRATAGR